MNKCGDHGMHWYHDGDTCMCGQIPKDIFFAEQCSCGAYRYRKPVHDPDCSQIQWAKKRNQWISEHPNINPPLDRVCYRVKEVFIEGKSGEEVAVEMKRQGIDPNYEAFLADRS